MAASTRKATRRSANKIYSRPGAASPCLTPRWRNVSAHDNEVVVVVVVAGVVVLVMVEGGFKHVELDPTGLIPSLASRGE